MVDGTSSKGKRLQSLHEGTHGISFGTVLPISYLYLKDETKLHDLIHGSQWVTMSEKMKVGYWNVAGLLNV